MSHSDVNDKNECNDDVYDSGQLYTPPKSGDDEEHEKFPAYKSGEDFKFQLGMVFNNKELMSETLKDYATKKMENAFIKKNDGR